MMKRLLYSIAALIVFISCAEEVIKKPDNLIEKERMIDILHDLAIINAAKITASNTLEEREFVPMEYIYNKYNVDSAQLVSSNLYYASLPLVYEDIYEQLEARIDSEKNSLESSRQQKKDSVKASRK
ncbi:DUF4296 domain-containing protein [Eudoraea chungangensis]|uniref:DUF4296 domain-containing protein n=1 Tax=Eudoraea chungangensis TaxID=1481905 RepID=UPI0023EAFEEA|nr:DUF4296 domain-containing protein [Eudoraea chungangensis]